MRVKINYIGQLMNKRISEYIYILRWTDQQLTLGKTFLSDFFPAEDSDTDRPSHITSHEFPIIYY